MKHIALTFFPLFAFSFFAYAAETDPVDAHYAAYLASIQEKLPSKGVAAFDGANLKNFHFSGDGPDAHFEFADVDGQAFSKCIRLKIPVAVDPSYKVQILSPDSTVAVKKGDFLFATVNARCIEAAANNGVFAAILQVHGSPWTTIGREGVIVGKEWKRVIVATRAEHDYAAGGYELTLHLGMKAQTLELGGFALLNLGQGVDPNALPYTPIAYPGQEPDAPWRKAAAERIEKIRKGDLTVHVTGADGKPLAGASVHIAMQRHAFGFGTFLEYHAMIGTGADSDKLREWTLKLFNRATTPIYWADWGWANADIRKDYMKCAKWAQDNMLTTRGHVIVYPAFQFMPTAMKALEKDPATLRQKVLDHVVDVVDATRAFAFRDYDVTNELRDLNDLHGLLGKDAVVEWFKVAREHAAPESHMAINENTILTRGGETNANQDNYAGWIQYLSDHGQAPDVIGMQGHFDANVTDPVRVLEILDRFAKFGKPLQITEFDLPIRDEDAQARYTRDFLTTIFSHPAMEAFTMWGFWEGQMWQPPAALLRKDFTVKPNGQAFMDLVLKQWWTGVTATTAADGSCATRGFLGDYKITVKNGGAEKSASVKLIKDGASVTVKFE